MNKAERIARLKETASKRPPLSPEAREILENLRDEEGLGIENAFGECLPAEDVRKEPKPEEPEDENEISLDVISPLMRAATD